jgi:hypothetical protein
MSHIAKNDFRTGNPGEKARSQSSVRSTAASASASGTRAGTKTARAKKKRGGFLDKTWFYEQCGPAGISTVPCYGPSAPPALGEEVWLKPRRGGNGEGHCRRTVDAYLLAELVSLCRTRTVQALEENHPQLREACPGSLASLRVQMLHEHLSRGRRLALSALAWPANVVGAPLMRRLQL